MERLTGVRRGRPIAIEVDGERITCWEGDTVASVILTWQAHISRDERRPRSLFCGIGVCFECVAEIDGIAGVRTCLTPATAGMRVRSSASGTGHA